MVRILEFIYSSMYGMKRNTSICICSCIWQQKKNSECKSRRATIINSTLGVPTEESPKVFKKILSAIR